MGLENLIIANRKYLEIEDMINGNPQQKEGFPKSEIKNTSGLRKTQKEEIYLRLTRSSRYTRDGK